MIIRLTKTEQHTKKSGYFYIYFISNLSFNRLFLSVCKCQSNFRGEKRKGKLFIGFSFHQIISVIMLSKRGTNLLRKVKSFDPNYCYWLRFPLSFHSFDRKSDIQSSSNLLHKNLYYKKKRVKNNKNKFGHETRCLKKVTSACVYSVLFDFVFKK